MAGAAAAGPWVFMVSTYLERTLRKPPVDRAENAAPPGGIPAIHPRAVPSKARGLAPLPPALCIDKVDGHLH